MKDNIARQVVGKQFPDDLFNEAIKEVVGKISFLSFSYFWQLELMYANSYHPFLKSKFYEQSKV